MLIVVLTVLFAVLLIPLLFLTHVPLKFDWPLFVASYLLRGLESLPIALALLASTMSLSKISLALRQRGSWDGLVRRFKAIMIPAVYLFFGVVIVFGYNDVIASVRFYALYDHLGAAFDSWLLRGSSVSALAHKIVGFKPVFGSLASFVYARFDSFVGAALLFLALKAGWQRAAAFVSTLMVQYYLSLIVFFFVPIQGPFYSSQLQPLGLETYEQKITLAQADLAWHHAKTIIGFDYFIGFPALHVGMLVVALWFLREWKFPRIVMALYLVLVIPSVMLVEWHYLVDVIGGVVVAVAAIAIARLASGSRPADRVHF